MYQSTPLAEAPLLVLACNENIKEDTPQRWGFSFETKRNDINKSLTKKNPREQYPRKNWVP